MKHLVGNFRCPNCNSLRIDGNRKRFVCKACGFVHNPFFKLKLKEEVRNGMVFRENLECLVVVKNEKENQFGFY